MILIADVGGTKSDWRLIAGKTISQFQSAGFNPKTHPFSQLEKIIPTDLSGNKAGIQKVCFYGAGIVGEEVKSKIKGIIHSTFQHAAIEIASDLTGAARSLFGKDRGVACILGTGAAACYYDGHGVTHRIPSLGYVLGDEGSGFYLGKQLLTQYLRGSLPEGLKRKFEDEFGQLTEEEVLGQVYEKAANAYVANYAGFAVQHQSDPYMYRLIYDGFSLFFQSYFGDTAMLQNEKIRFTGSIAHLLSNVLLKVARDKKLTVDLISQNPISGLTLYHQENG